MTLTKAVSIGGAEVRQELFTYVIVLEVIVKMASNNLLLNFGENWQIGYGPIVLQLCYASYPFKKDVLFNVLLTCFHLRFCKATI